MSYLKTGNVTTHIRVNTYSRDSPTSIGNSLPTKDETLSGGLRVSEEMHKRIVPTEVVD
jgi:hypothetical protein